VTSSGLLCRGRPATAATSKANLPFLPARGAPASPDGSSHSTAVRARREVVRKFRFPGTAVGPPGKAARLPQVAGQSPGSMASTFPKVRTGGVWLRYASGRKVQYSHRTGLGGGARRGGEPREAECPRPSRGVVGLRCRAGRRFHPARGFGGRPARRPGRKGPRSAPASRGRLSAGVRHRSARAPLPGQRLQPGLPASAERPGAAVTRRERGAGRRARMRASGGGGRRRPPGG